MGHSEFMQAHPVVRDFYTAEEKQAASQLLSRGIVASIFCIYEGESVHVGSFLFAILPCANGASGVGRDDMRNTVARALFRNDPQISKPAWFYSM